MKRRNKENHLNDLREVFLRLGKYKLKMNPLKCFFGVPSGKFIGFIVRKYTILVDPVKTKAIIKMKSPSNFRVERIAGKVSLYPQIYFQFI